jgi:hypothetical protein
MATENKKMQQRRDTAANWASKNPTLSAGEVGFEIDTGYLKVGDGASAWNDIATYYRPTKVGTTTIAADGVSTSVSDADVDSNSIIRAWLQTNDETAKSAIAVAGSGSFTIYLNAQASAAVTVGYEVIY